MVIFKSYLILSKLNYKYLIHCGQNVVKGLGLKLWSTLLVSNNYIYYYNTSLYTLQKNILLFL